MSEQPPPHEDADAESYAELTREVDKNFGGKWAEFLKAVRNPAEILYFVLWRQCEGKATKFEAWAKQHEVPDEWLPRFYGMLTPKGEFQPNAVTRAPAPPADQPAAAADKVEPSSNDQ